MPAHCLHQSRLERLLRPPAQLPLNLSRRRQVVPRPSGHEQNQLGVGAGRPRIAFAEVSTNEPHHFQIGTLSPLPPKCHVRPTHPLPRTCEAPGRDSPLELLSDVVALIVSRVRV